MHKMNIDFEIQSAARTIDEQEAIVAHESHIDIRVFEAMKGHPEVIAQIEPPRIRELTHERLAEEAYRMINLTCRHEPMPYIEKPHQNKNSKRHHRKSRW